MVGARALVWPSRAWWAAMGARGIPRCSRLFAPWSLSLVSSFSSSRVSCLYKSIFFLLEFTAASASASPHARCHFLCPSLLTRFEALPCRFLSSKFSFHNTPHRNIVPPIPQSIDRYAFHQELRHLRGHRHPRHRCAGPTHLRD